MFFKEEEEEEEEEEEGQNSDAKTLTRVKKLTQIQRKSLFLKDKKRVHVWHDDCIYISESKKSSLKSLIWRATK